jgi:hypothetical protein
MPSGKRNKYEKGYFNAFDGEYNGSRKWWAINPSDPDKEAKKAKQIAKKKKRKK